MPVAFLSASHAAPLALLDPDVPAAAGVSSGGSRGAEPESELSRAALRLVSDLVVDSLLAAVPQQMRENYKRQVWTPPLAPSVRGVPI